LYAAAARLIILLTVLRNISNHTRGTSEQGGDDDHGTEHGWLLREHPALAGGEDARATRFHEITIMNGSPLLYFDGEA